ncbi:MAG TPA: phosphoribulokinase [Solirubrobacteraceae bacterium]|jgi:phosphoribulokinase|nr:phosphoribulokinase [Solirubrobacteraceae bacterium]
MTEPPRPILLGIVGDSAAGKTTLTRGLVRILGEQQVTHVCADHYHRYDRAQRAQRGLTPLTPESNYIDILEQHLAHLRAGEPIIKPVYRHSDGTFGPPEYVRPAHFTIIEGLLGFHSPAMRGAYDARVFLDPPEDVRRGWKVQRDCSRRGYTTDQVLDELDRREADSDFYIRPQRRHADMVISFMPGDRGDQEHLDVRIVLRPDLAHPDLSPLVEGDGSYLAIEERAAETTLWVSGTIPRTRSAEIEEAVWNRMQFASHLRTERLGEFTVGTQLHRSESLAITQLLVLYQLVTARAAVALGATDARVDQRASSDASEPSEPADSSESSQAPVAAPPSG